MPTVKNPDMNGSAPDTHDTALLIIDMLNPMDFEGSEGLIEAAIPAAKAIAGLKARAKQNGIPVIYVNDNFGRWRSELDQIVSFCVRPEAKAREVAELLKPDEDDYFVLKPKHSGFYLTSLEILLEHLGVENLILTGVAGNICVWFTANDAHMRDFKIWAPSDCSASNSPEDNCYALEQMEKVMGAVITPAAQLRLPLRPESSHSKAPLSKVEASQESRPEHTP